MSPGDTTRVDDAPAELAAPVEFQPRIRRFEVRAQIGEGGMGVVFDAWDPELKRRVAIKLVRPALRTGSHDSDGEARLQREAESMARLSHPNVVQIYEVGQWDGAVFLAMEYVEGDNLREWLERAPRTWRDVVAVFLDAGRGLVAAHAAGIVHRDFKPENVVVGLDGRTRVLDFGLARAEPDPTRLTSDDDHPATLTRAGSLLGTPAYMSPEQHRRRRADARSDQFSFCVALYEALYGERPFAGKTAAEVRAAVFGPPPPLPRGPKVPRRFHKILLRGLRVDPEARYPDMRALLGDLADDPAARRRRLGLTAGALGLAAAAIVAARPDDPALRCPAAADRLAGVWDAPRRAAARDAVLATDLPYAAVVWPKVQAALDAWADAWVAARDDACAATHVRRVASEELLHLRGQCLDAGLRDLAALVDTLVTADGPTVEHALAAAQELPPTAACVDEASVRARLKPPADPALADAVQRVRDRLAEVDALRLAGRTRAAREVAERAEALAESLPYPPLRAELLVARAGVDHHDGDFAAARERLVLAFDAALAVAHDVAAADAAILLANVAEREHDFADGLAWSRHAASMITRTGEQPRQRSHALLIEAFNLNGLGRYDEAVAVARQALALAESSLPAGDLLRLRIASGLGLVHTRAERWDAALAVYRRTQAEWEPVLGREHPILARIAFNVGIILKSRRDPGARAELEAALATLARILGPDHPDIGTGTGFLGTVAVDDNRLRDAVADFRRAEAILSARLGPDHPNIVIVLASLQLALSLLGEFDEALAVARRTLTLCQGRVPRDDAAVDRARVYLSDVLVDVGRLDEAEAECRAVLELPQRVAEPEARAYALQNLARIARLRGDPRAAEDLAVRAHAVALTIADFPDAYLVHLQLGEARLARGRPDAALTDCSVAVQLAEPQLGAESLRMIAPRLCLARAHLARGATDAAIAELERTLATATAHELRPDVRAEVRTTLAAALRTRDPARAASLTAAARADHEAARARMPR